uniref:Uncharacterized protein n=1 Tax=Anguilla anguilla TaxID=7936 RepID=A0A0E9QQJ6_ANGAN
MWAISLSLCSTRAVVQSSHPVLGVSGPPEAIPSLMKYASKSLPEPSLLILQREMKAS